MDWDQTRHKLFDQAVNSLCVVSLIFVKSQRKKNQETRGCKKRQTLLPSVEGSSAWKGIICPSCGRLHVAFATHTTHYFSLCLTQAFERRCTFLLFCSHICSSLWFCREEIRVAVTLLSKQLSPCKEIARLSTLPVILQRCTLVLGKSLKLPSSSMLAFGLVLKVLFLAQVFLNICGHIDFHLFYFFEAHQGILSCRGNIWLLVCLSNPSKLLSLIGCLYVCMYLCEILLNVNALPLITGDFLQNAPYTSYLNRNNLTEKPARISFEWLLYNNCVLGLLTLLRLVLNISCGFNSSVVILLRHGLSGRFTQGAQNGTEAKSSRLVFLRSVNLNK